MFSPAPFQAKTEEFVQVCLLDYLYFYSYICLSLAVALAVPAIVVVVLVVDDEAFSWLASPAVHSKCCGDRCVAAWMLCSRALTSS